MRNFEERKAEVFRRSEKRIKERKRNRNRILACCIPLCLCITILSVIYLPNANLFSDKSGNAEDMNMAGGLNGTSEFIYTSLEITNNIESTGNSRKENDIANIENIYNIIQSSFSAEEDLPTGDKHDEFPHAQKGEGANKDENHSGIDQFQNYTKGMSYTITFIAVDGTQRNYTLDGNLLTNKATKQEVTLTDSQMSELQKALGLEFTWEEESK